MNAGIGATRRLRMAKKLNATWADEMENFGAAAVDARVEPFFLACMIKYGDPDVWLMPLQAMTRTKTDVYFYADEFIKNSSVPYSRRDLVGGYMIWYDREKSKLPTVDTRPKTP